MADDKCPTTVCATFKKETPMTDSEYRTLELHFARVRLADRQRAHAFKMAIGHAELELDAQVRRGDLTPACRDLLMTAYHGQEFHFAQGSELTVPIELVQRIVKLNAHLPLGERAVDKGEEFTSAPDVELAEKATRVMATEGLDYGAAVQVVFTQNPGLKARYLAHLSGGSRT